MALLRRESTLYVTLGGAMTGVCMQSDYSYLHMATSIIIVYLDLLNPLRKSSSCLELIVQTSFKRV